MKFLSRGLTTSRMTFGEAAGGLDGSFTLFQHGGEMLALVHPSWDEAATGLVASGHVVASDLATPWSVIPTRDDSLLVQAATGHVGRVEDSALVDLTVPSCTLSWDSDGDGDDEVVSQGTYSDPIIGNLVLADGEEPLCLDDVLAGTSWAPGAVLASGDVLLYDRTTSEEPAPASASASPSARSSAASGAPSGAMAHASASAAPDPPLDTYHLAAYSPGDGTITDLGDRAWPDTRGGILELSQYDEDTVTVSVYSQDELDLSGT